MEGNRHCWLARGSTGSTRRTLLQSFVLQGHLAPICGTSLLSPTAGTEKASSWQLQSDMIPWEYRTPGSLMLAESAVGSRTRVLPQPTPAETVDLLNCARDAGLE